MKHVFTVLAVFLVAGSSVPGLATAGDGQVSQAVADTWPARWCQAQPGNTKAELLAVMGPASWTTATTMTWSAHQYQFNAFLDANGKINQLDINTHSLSAAEQAALKCDTIRTRATVARAAAKAAAVPQRARPEGCGLVTDAEMSAILGAKVVGDPRRGATECNYRPVSGISPTVKLSVDWGDGKVAMASARFMDRREPGITSPYAGIGDEAVAVGPSLMIRTGADLVTIVFNGVTGAPAKAKRIFDTAKGKM